MQFETTQPSSFAACPRCLRVNKVDLSRAESAQPSCGACGTLIDFHQGVLNAGTRQLERTIKSAQLPVIVDFWAPWCMPCRGFAPTFGRVARERTGAAVFVKVNTEEDPSTSQAFGIRGLPTLAAFKNGKEIERLAGAPSYEHFMEWVVRVLRA